MPASFEPFPVNGEVERKGVKRRGGAEASSARLLPFHEDAAHARRSSVQTQARAAKPMHLLIHHSHWGLEAGRQRPEELYHQARHFMCNPESGGKFEKHVL